MTAADDAASSAAATTAGPMREVQVGGSLVTLLGTAHVSRQSAEQVARELDSRAYIVPGLGDAGDRLFGTSH